MNALQKVNTELMERYTTTCKQCGWIRQFFGTAEEARKSAETMGWEFRREVVRVCGGSIFAGPTDGFKEQAYCPHCKLLVKG